MKRSECLGQSLANGGADISVCPGIMSFRLGVITLAAALLALSTAGRHAVAEEPAAKPLRALLVLGGCCHAYKTQKHILVRGIAERARVEVTVAYDPDTTTRHLNPVYQNPDW